MIDTSGRISEYKNNPFLTSVMDPVVFISVDPSSKSTGGTRPLIEQRSFDDLGDGIGLDSYDVLDQRVISLKVTGAKNKASVAEMTFWNEDLKLLGHPIMQKGTVVRVIWGYAGYVSKPRKFRVYKVKGTRARVSNFGRLTIIAKGQSFDLNQKPKSRKWKNTTPPKIAERIAKEYGYIGSFVEVGNDSFVPRTYTQVNQTDAQFLTSLAKKICWAFSCDDGSFRFYPHSALDAAIPVAHYDYYTDEDGWIKRFEPESNIIESIGSITVKSRDPLTGKPIKYTASVQNRKNTSLGRYVESLPAEQPGFNVGVSQNRTNHRNKSPNSSGVIPSGVVVNKPLSSIRTVKEEAFARQLNRQLQGIKARTVLIGDPDIWYDDIISLGNLGGGLDGTFKVAECVHIIDDRGYELDCKVRKNAVDSIGKGVRPKSSQKAKSKNNMGRKTKRVKSVKVQTNQSRTGVLSKRRYTKN